MTFDEAIKTLQKASAQARTKQYSTSTVRTGPGCTPLVKEPARERTPPPAPAAAPEAVRRPQLAGICRPDGR